MKEVLQFLKVCTTINSMFPQDLILFSPIGIHWLYSIPMFQQYHECHLLLGKIPNTKTSSKKVQHIMSRYRICYPVDPRGNCVLFFIVIFHHLGHPMFSSLAPGTLHIVGLQHLSTYTLAQCVSTKNRLYIHKLSNSPCKILWEIIWVILTITCVSKAANICHALTIR